MGATVKHGRKIGIFLKPNVSTDPATWAEREVYITLQGSKTGKPASVKLKINAGKRHPVIQSNTGAVMLTEMGQLEETFNPNQAAADAAAVAEVAAHAAMAAALKAEAEATAAADAAAKAAAEASATASASAAYAGVVAGAAAKAAAAQKAAARAAKLANKGLVG